MEKMLDTLMMMRKQSQNTRSTQPHEHYTIKQHCVNAFHTEKSFMTANPETFIHLSILHIYTEKQSKSFIVLTVYRVNPGSTRLSSE